MKYEDRKIVANCAVCGTEFIKRSAKHKYCDKCKEEAKKRIYIQYNQKRKMERGDDFSEGEIWVLDEKTWEWSLEVRGEEND